MSCLIFNRELGRSLAFAPCGDQPRSTLTGRGQHVAYRTLDACLDLFSCERFVDPQQDTQMSIAAQQFQELLRSPHWVHDAEAGIGQIFFQIAREHVDAHLRTGVVKEPAELREAMAFGNYDPVQLDGFRVEHYVDHLSGITPQRLHIGLDRVERDRNAIAALLRI